ncbi:MAG: VTT domain-containing protein [Hyphomicrobiaceae bacterium]|nr:VTT domain-containing protein [Hyphomicrobiaceae bacterium]MCC0022658.1 VTT domain-containing protein [Hyphomicrobiaceae bacterium]
MTEKRNWTRYWPIALIALAIALFFGSGLNSQISIDSLAVNYAAITAYVDANPVLAYLAAGVLYVVAVAVAFPAAWIITVGFGVVFGWVNGSILVIISATLGACLLYWAARTLLADFFKARAGRWLNEMAEGFRRNAASYLLFLRLTPVAPFVLLNALPGLLNVPFFTYAWTTALGIIPGTIAYVSAGEGLRAIVAERAEACAANVPPCGEPLSPSDLVRPETLIAISLLALVSLLPVVLKWWRGRTEAGKAGH